MTARHDDGALKIIDVGPTRINRLNDRFAKYLLTGPRSKPVLIDFINEALLFSGDDRVSDVEAVSGELAQGAAKLKLSVLDVSARLTDGRTADIEIQVVNYHDFRKRGPFYWALRHARKLMSGMAYAEIKPTITICLLAFDLLEEEEAYRNSYSIRNDKSGNCLSQDMNIIYLELPKFRRHLGDGYARTGLERWLLYFSNEEGERMDRAVAENPALSTAREIETVFWADEKEREQYFAHQRMLMDAYSAEHTHEYLIAEAKKEGREEGKKEGREEGEKEGVEKVARSMLAKGISIAAISECTGLDEKAILSL
ncbi:MAG: Rpn family recombination-promoting nuclease/putative transposase [Synergistaceae bacterium]|jgi:predicted transposase/invertase (TIGR01784 family)|nr:Rpn family recombination-promoting nuclease/putative transposase [Synergistaceae bacterium]